MIRYKWTATDWPRIHQAEDRLINYFLANRGTDRSEKAWNKAQDLRDAYDSRMNTHGEYNPNGKYGYL